MVVIDSGIENRDNYIAASGRDIPCLGCIDIGIRGPARLTDIVKSPHLPKPRIIGCERCSQNIVWLGIQDIGVLSINTNRFFDGDTARQLDNLQPAYNLEDLFACTGPSKSG